MPSPSPDGAPVVLILASGKARRFLASGGAVNKLQAPLAGRAVLQHVLAAVQRSALPWHLVTGVEGGMGSSIAAGVAATRDAGGWLVLPGDLPLVQPNSLVQVAALLARHAAVVPNWQGQRGHPVGFAPACREQLLQLAGETGAAPIVKALRERGGVADLALDDAGIVRDIDTLEDLQRIEALMRAGGDAAGPA